jgi:hypothetical protein
MLSCARVYVFCVEYQKSTWLTFNQANELAGLIAQMFSTGIKELTFKNIQFINVYQTYHDEKQDNKFGTQIHINKITYYKQKILSKEQVAELRTKIKNQLKKVLQLKFEDVLVVNDEFEFKSTQGFAEGGQ